MIGTPKKKYELRGPLAERLDEAAASEEMESNDLIDYIVRRYLDEVWVFTDEEEEDSEGDSGETPED